LTSNAANSAKLTSYPLVQYGSVQNLSHICSGNPPLTAIAGQLDFSECILHGVFVDEVMRAQANSFVSDDPLCRAYWDPVPLNVDSAAHFIHAVQPTDVAVAISSKSRTPLAVREEIFSTLRATGPGLQVRKFTERSAR
jgi:hypothetical protein